LPIELNKFIPHHIHQRHPEGRALARGVVRRTATRSLEILRDAATCPLLRMTVSFFRASRAHDDDAENDPAISREHRPGLVDFLRSFPAASPRLRIGGRLRQREILHHQGRSQARLVAVLGGRDAGYRTRHRALARQRQHCPDESMDTSHALVR